MCFILRFTSLFCLCLSIASAHADDSSKALVIVDMQPVFAKRNFNKDPGNAQKLEALIQKQKQMIAAAKQRGIPIMIVEYGSTPAKPGLNAMKYEPTNSDLLKSIGDYDKTVTVFKDKDGLFHPENTSREAAKQKLKEWGTKDLIVVGANGNGCMASTIDGALKANYNVYAYSDGIADFNEKSFVYPYSYQEQEPERYPETSFHEFNNINQIFPPSQQSRGASPARTVSVGTAQ